MPLTVDIVASKWEQIGSALILAQHLDRRARWRFPGTIEFSQSSFARSHNSFPALSRRGAPPAFPLPALPCRVYPFLGKSFLENHNAGLRYQCGIYGVPDLSNLL